jgi:hypothetical protein
MPSTKETGIRSDAKFSDLYPALQTAFDYAPPAPAAPVEKPGDQEASAEDPERPLMSVAIRFPGLDHLVVIVFQIEAAEALRAEYPAGTAFWSAEAFRRFLDDARGLSDLARRQLLVSANLVKSVLGGSYEGLVPAWAARG